MKISKLTKEELVFLVEKYDNIHQILKHLGVNANGSGAYKTFKNHCDRMGVKIPKNKNKGRQNFGNKIPLEEILVENSTYQNRSRLKIRLIRNGLLNYECEICNIKEWNGKKISLHLDHINGVNNDNRIENLRFLCPNCHSQTDTHGSKKLKKKKRKGA